MSSPLDQLCGRKRTHYCGDLRPSEDGKEVFEVEFQPPAPGQYHLSVQLHKADGQHLHSDAAV